MSTGTKRQRTVRPSPALFIPDFQVNRTTVFAGSGFRPIFGSNVNRYSILFQNNSSGQVWIRHGEIQDFFSGTLQLGDADRVMLLYKDFPGLVGDSWDAQLLGSEGFLWVTEVIHRPRECP